MWKISAMKHHDQTITNAASFCTSPVSDRCQSFQSSCKNICLTGSSEVRRYWEEKHALPGYIQLLKVRTQAVSLNGSFRDGNWIVKALLLAACRNLRRRRTSKGRLCGRWKHIVPTETLCDVSHFKWWDALNSGLPIDSSVEFINQNNHKRSFFMAIPIWDVFKCDIIYTGQPISKVTLWNPFSTC